jgi:hypothetical protein
MNAICRICHHPLSDPFSVRVGMGPVCRSRENKQGLLDFLHAKIKIIKHVRGNHIFIRDIGHISRRSVTNDAEYVVEQLYLDFGIDDDTRIFYEDSEGSIDELLHSGRKFRGFKFGHEGIDVEGGHFEYHE